MESLISSIYHSPRAVALAILALLYILRRLLLPRPLPGIPFNPSAANSLLGDLPTIMREAPENAHRWVISQTRKHDSPLVQIFLLPFRKPCLVLSDFREGQDIMLRRKEFDRSSLVIDTIGAEAPNAHANMRTGPVWKAHRKLLQDLMAPEFLHGVAAPNIYRSAKRLMELWKMKEQIVGAVPFAAKEDLFYASVDAIFDFGYGDAAAERALIPQLDKMNSLTAAEKKSLREQAVPEDGITFPAADIPSPIEALLKTAENVLPPAAYGFPTIGWGIIGMIPSVRRMRKIKNSFIKEHVLKSAAKLENDSSKDREVCVKSAVDHIVERERAVAASLGREPIYWSDAIRDEVYGFGAAGHETTSTALCWGIKFLPHNLAAQHRLRGELHAAYTTAATQNRPPTTEEMTATHIPYLDAVVEETVRLAHMIPMQEREALHDTVILGHPIPKGTFVFIANQGPGFTEPAIDVDEATRSTSCQAALKDKRTIVLRDEEQVDMGEFRPERWLAMDEEGKETFDATRWPSSPFGAGRRGCFGQKLARMELRIILTLMVWNFELLPPPGKLSSLEDVQMKLREPRHCYVSLKSISS